MDVGPKLGSFSIICNFIKDAISSPGAARGACAAKSRRCECIRCEQGQIYMQEGGRGEIGGEQAAPLVRCVRGACAFRLCQAPQACSPGPAAASGHIP